jgi:hypothetical protein
MQVPQCLCYYFTSDKSAETQTHAACPQHATQHTEHNMVPIKRYAPRQHLHETIWQPSALFESCCSKPASTAAARPQIRNNLCTCCHCCKPAPRHVQGAVSKALSRGAVTPRHMDCIASTNSNVMLLSSWCQPWQLTRIRPHPPSMFSEPSYTSKGTASLCHVL